MGRREDRVFRINDQIAATRAEVARAEVELSMLRHIDDDAQRDAALGDPFDRADARQTAADVTRMEREIARLQEQIEKLEAKRAKLLRRLTS